jgi:hypothetical protein
LLARHLAVLGRRDLNDLAQVARGDVSPAKSPTATPPIPKVYFGSNSQGRIFRDMVRTCPLAAWGDTPICPTRKATSAASKLVHFTRILLSAAQRVECRERPLNRDLLGIRSC